MIYYAGLDNSAEETSVCALWMKRARSAVRRNCRAIRTISRTSSKTRLDGSSGCALRLALYRSGCSAGDADALEMRDLKGPSREAHPLQNGGQSYDHIVRSNSCIDQRFEEARVLRAAKLHQIRRFRQFEVIHPDPLSFHDRVR
jgi:hypothetical protein